MGMGKTFYDNSSEARSCFEQADKILGFSLSALCFQGPEEQLRQTENAQPALFVVSAIATLLLKAKGIKPDLVAGHSLGECTALWAAGAFDFEQGVRLVRKRGSIMAEAGKKNPGSMAAILGLDSQAVADLCRECSDAGIVEPANYNCPGQVVISGHKQAVAKAMEKAKEKGAAKVVALAVSGAFHSKLLEEASEEFGEFLGTFPFQAPNVGVVSNARADFVRTPEAIRQALKEQLKSTVRWEECVKKLKENGVDQFFEAGAGKVLTGLLKRIDKASKCYYIGEWEDLADLGARP